MQQPLNLPPLTLSGKKYGGQRNPICSCNVVAGRHTSWRFTRHKDVKQAWPLQKHWQDRPPHFLANEESHTLNFETEGSTSVKLLRPTLSFW